LREDNAYDRLISVGRSLGLVDDYVMGQFLHDRDRLDWEHKRLHKTSIAASLVDPAANGDRLPMGVLLRRPNVTYQHLAGVDEECARFPARLGERLEILIKYAGYMEKQQREIDRFRQLESREIPDDFDLGALSGLKREAISVLEQYRPINLGQASRLNGITFSDITVLMIHLKRHYAGTVSRETK
jgi:tRNA uridine 5-carboxymethylaminomethyl modification enzyme